MFNLSFSPLLMSNSSSQQNPQKLLDETLSLLPEAGVDEQQALLLQLQQQVQLSNLINEINIEIRRSLDLDEILNSACQLLGVAVNCDRVCILVAEPGDEEFLIVGGEYNQSGYPPRLGLKVRIADDPHLQMLSHNHEVPSSVALCTDCLGIGTPTTEVIQAGGVPSRLTIATRYQGQMNGAIELHQCDRRNSYLDSQGRNAQRNSLREWTVWEQDLLEGVVSQLAIAIHQARLHAQACHQAERESLLRVMTNQIHQSLDLEEILQTAVREVRQFLNTSRVVVYQFMTGWEGKVVVEDVVSDWNSILGDMSYDSCFTQEYARLYEGGRVRTIHNIYQSGLAPCHINFLQRLQVQANLIVPILIDSNLWGLLIAHECPSPRVWHTWETDLLQQLANQMAIAIQQSQLYSQAQTSAIRAKRQAEQLKATLKELQTTQMQLIQSEKLSSLGQMVAGVAHEINNANNFIYGNLPYVQNYAELLEQTLSIYAATYPESIAAIAELNTDFELDDVRQDFPKVLRSMQEGTNRIREIVLTLQKFCRLDQARRKPVDLHEGIESTLTILQHRLKEGIKINKQYNNLPKVKCHAGQINQVFLNILNNALDAAGEQAELTIYTHQSSSDWVTISIRDNGPGIPLEIQSRIFDPFFTTKEVGQGTGLGLSICYQIICQNHKGRLRCISQPGQGAEFQIELPIGSLSKLKVEG